MYSHNRGSTNIEVRSMIKGIIDSNETVKASDRTIGILHQFFSDCFNNEGKFDIERFKTRISEEVSIIDEGYELNFLGKSYAQLLASIDTTTVIVPDVAHNSKPENADSQNIYISGDNMDGLKHLLKSYAGKVKCIYIDPPYNTGSDGFVYNDNFNFTSEELQVKLSIDKEQADKILDLTKRGSASHSAWLMFMMPRLVLAKDLLTEDGVIFISIDDNEQANLKLLCDHVFGEENLISVFCKKGTGAKQDSTHFARIHEYVICYANSKFQAGEEEKENDTFPYTDKNGRKFKTMLLRKWGDAASREDRPNMYYPIYYKNGCYSLKDDLGEGTSVIYPMIGKSTAGRWRWGKDTMDDAIKKDLLEAKIKDNEIVLYEKIYEPDEDCVATKLFNTWIDNVNAKSGKALLKELFDGESPFEYPKPLDLIKLLVKMGNAMDGIVLDFFSGSATTAHAVMQMNAEDGDHRRYIMIQLPEACKDKSIAHKMKFNTIDEIGQDRIKRAAKKIKDETGADIDYGFKHYTLAEPSDKTLAELENFNPKTLFADENLLDEFGRDTVLETWQVNDGYGFGAEHTPLVLDTYTVYLMGKHLYMTDPGLTEKDMVALVDKYLGDTAFNPENIVIFGYSFTFTQTEMLRKNLVTLRDGEKNLKINLDIRY